MAARWMQPKLAKMAKQRAAIPPAYGTGKDQARADLASALAGFTGTVAVCEVGEFRTAWGKRAGADPRIARDWNGCERRTRGGGLVATYVR